MLKLLQGYYHFLSLWKFMEQVIITNDLSELAMSIAIPTWEKSSFTLKEWLIKNLLSSIHAHPKQRNIYGYLTEVSSFKGIFSIMRELIENDESFRNFLKEILKDQYFPFEQTIRFVRNVLNHWTTSNLLIKQEDYEVQKDFILSPKVQRVNNLKGSALIKLNFVYSKYITQRKGSKDYWIQLSIDFKRLKPGLQLEKLISWHNLYLLSELCYNLSLLRDVKHKTLSKPIKRNVQSNKVERKHTQQRRTLNRNKK
jgi:hypothetical protein